MNDEVHSHSALLQGEVVFMPAKIILRLFILLPPKADFSTKRLMRLQWRNVFGDGVKLKQNTNYYRRLEVEKQETGTIKTSEATPIDVCFWNYSRKHPPRAMIDFSFTGYIYIYVFSVWNGCSIHQDTQRCSSKRDWEEHQRRKLEESTWASSLLTLTTESCKGKQRNLTAWMSWVRVVSCPSTLQCHLLLASH